jgi:hypothetical protein
MSKADEIDEKDKDFKALDESDIALLKTYVGFSEIFLVFFWLKILNFQAGDFCVFFSDFHRNFWSGFGTVLTQDQGG